VNAEETVSAGRDAIALARAYIARDDESADAVLEAMSGLEHELTLIAATSMLGQAVHLLSGWLLCTPDVLFDALLVGVEEAEVDFTGDGCES
jgi:hypothetical protein